MVAEQSEAFQQGYKDFSAEIHYNVRYTPMSQEWRDWIEGYNVARDIGWFFMNGE